MTCWRKVSTGGFSQKKTAPFPVPFLSELPYCCLFLLLVFFRCLGLRGRSCGRRRGRGRGGGRRGRGGGGRPGERAGDAALLDRDRLHLAALELEDRHLGVLA